MTARLEIEQHRGHAVARVLADAIEDTNAPQLRNDLIRELNSADARLVVDLEAVRVMTSAGLGTLVALHNHARADGGSIAIVHASTHIAETLRLTNLDRVLNLRDSIDEACDSLTGIGP